MLALAGPDLDGLQMRVYKSFSMPLTPLFVSSQLLMNRKLLLFSTFLRIFQCYFDLGRSWRTTWRRKRRMSSIKRCRKKPESFEPGFEGMWAKRYTRLTTGQDEYWLWFDRWIQTGSTRSCRKATGQGRRGWGRGHDSSERQSIYLRGSWAVICCGLSNFTVSWQLLTCMQNLS